MMSVAKTLPLGRFGRTEPGVKAAMTVGGLNTTESDFRGAVLRRMRPLVDDRTLRTAFPVERATRVPDVAIAVGLLAAACLIFVPGATGKILFAIGAVVALFGALGTPKPQTILVTDEEYVLVSHQPDFSRPEVVGRAKRNYPLIAGLAEDGLRPVERFGWVTDLVRSLHIESAGTGSAKPGQLTASS